MLGPKVDIGKDLVQRPLQAAEVDRAGRPDELLLQVSVADVQAGALRSSAGAGEAAAAAAAADGTRRPDARTRSLPAVPAGLHNGAVSAQEVDRYLDALAEPERATLARLRQTILDILPDAEQAISYGVPGFKVGGKTIAGFAAFRNHLSYLPHSGSVFPLLKDELAGYSTSSGALRFGVGKPLPRPLVEKLIAVRLGQAFPA